MIDETPRKLVRRKMTLKNGLTVSVVHLRRGMLEKPRLAYQTFLKLYELEREMTPEAYAQYYMVTFRFKKNALRALVCVQAVAQVLLSLSSRHPENALDFCAGIFLNDRLVYSTVPEHDEWDNPQMVLSDPTTAFDPVVRIMKQAIARNISPNVASLICREGETP